jgi:hypothetical protein
MAKWRSGVFEASWRSGGASTAELAALAEYGSGHKPPPHAAIHFRAVDPQRPAHSVHPRATNINACVKKSTSRVVGSQHSVIATVLAHLRG